MNAYDPYREPESELDAYLAIGVAVAAVVTLIFAVTGSQWFAVPLIVAVVLFTVTAYRYGKRRWREETARLDAFLKGEDQ